MKLTKQYLKSLPIDKRKKAILREYYKCSKDIFYTIETYFTVLAGTKGRIPFILYPHQRDSISGFEAYTNSLLMKTRQMGLTTVTAVYIAFKIIFNNNFKVPIISKDMGSAKEFLKEIKDMLDTAREDYPWLVPDYLPGYNNKQNFILTNGSLVKAEGGDQAGRGTPGATMAVIDEVAFIDKKYPGKMDSIWAAISPTLASTKGKSIMISTPAGSSGWYYETYTNAKEKGFNIIDAHWTRHPVYSQGQYQWIANAAEENGGHIQFADKPWPETIFDKDSGTYIKLSKEEYPFVCDGKVRSPWYDFNAIKLGPRLSKCELDCSFVGTGGEVLDSDILREIKLLSDASSWSNPYEHIKGLFQSYKEYKSFEEGQKYVLSADVATGDGTDYSTFVVLNLATLEICATFKAQLLPLSFAEVLYIVGRDFGSCQLVVENQGGGFTVLQSLLEKGYSNIYYSTLNKKDPSTGMKKRKIGLWCSDDVRTQGGDQLEQKIRMNEIQIICSSLCEELFNWVWDKDGKRRHAPGKNDDLIMALQHGLWYARYVFKRSERVRKNIKNLLDNGNKEKIKITNSLNARGTIIRETTILSNNENIPVNIDDAIEQKVLTPLNKNKTKRTEVPVKRRTFIG